jgi:hypothetical protein
VNRRNNPWVILVIAVLGAGLSGYAGWQLVVVGTRTYKVGDLEIIHGKLLRSQELRVARSEVLQIELFDQPLPFRGSSVSYARCYNKNVLEHLVTGCEVEVGVLPDEERKPWRDYFRDQQFLNIYSLAVNGEVAFSLEDFNRCARANEKVGRRTIPIMLIFSLALLTYALWIIVEQRKAKLGALSLSLSL